MSIKYKDQIIANVSQSSETPGTTIDNNVYSEEEVRIGTYFGKPLYRRVVEKSSPELLAVFTRSDAILSCDIVRIQEADTIVDVRVRVVGNDSIVPLPGSFVYSTYPGTGGIRIDLDNTIVAVKSGSNARIVGASKVICTIEYTKSTDEEETV